MLRTYEMKRARESVSLDCSLDDPTFETARISKMLTVVKRFTDSDRIR